MAELLLHQEIVLLSLDDSRGSFQGSYYTYAVAGAMVSELLLQNRIQTATDKKKTVSVVSQEPTGDAILDEVLQQIVDSNKARALQTWVSRVSGIKHSVNRIAEQLVRLGVLKHDEKKILWLFNKQIYPELDGTLEDHVRRRMANVMFDAKAVLDERTTVLVALASHSQLLKANFEPVELKQHRKRIKKIAAGELLASNATLQAITAVQAAVMVACIMPAVVN